MKQLIKEEKIAKYSEFNLKQMKDDYRNFRFPQFLYFIILIGGTYCIFHFADSDSRWIYLGFVLILLPLYGFCIIISPLILRIIIPLMMFLVSLIFFFLIFFQTLFVDLAGYIEKNLNKSHA